MINAVSLGSPPFSLLLVSGIHGDEAASIPLLKEEVSTFSLPPTLFIPEMSPSAIQLGTRENGMGNNLNRMFGNDSDSEALEIKNIVSAHSPFLLTVSFHEHVGETHGYFYDVGEHFYAIDQVAWIESIQKIGIEPLNGVDDPEDPHLNYEFVDGYNYDPTAESADMFEYWVVHKNHSPRSLTIEIPGAVSITQKKLFIQACFQYLILPAFATQGDILAPSYAAAN